jgi:predicted Rossmann-fold nucleotide-binding protein
MTTSPESPAGAPRAQLARRRSSTFHDLEALEAHLARGRSLEGASLQGLDLRGVDWSKVGVRGALFLGCRLAAEGEPAVREGGGLVFPDFDGLPYDPYRSSLYTWRELLEGHDPERDESLDRRIYDHFVARGRHNPDLPEALAQRLHDHAIDDALRDLIGVDGDGMTGRRLVGIMGGHGVPRGAPAYRAAARIARRLAREGYFLVSGGGPGVMEATNLGAYLSGEDAATLEAAVDELQAAPRYTMRDYVPLARRILDGHPPGLANLAIPTWFYGHEPSNVFATRIAKYFSNSLREDALLSFCLHGIVYAPGSAGTVQEIFTDAAQNHYASLGWVSPMVFLGRERYVEETGLYPLLERLAEGRRYRELLCCSDDPEQIVAFIREHPPVRSSGGS